MSQKISIIIPVLNEAKILEKTLSQLQSELGVPRTHHRKTVEALTTLFTIAEKYGKVLKSERGRAKQLNAGAAAALGDIFIFLHADIWLESGALAAVERALFFGIRRWWISSENRWKKNSSIA